MKIKITENTKLLEFLFKALPDSKRTRVKILLKSGDVSINGKSTTQFDHPLRPGDELEISRHKNRALTPVREAKIKIVHEDDDIVVIQKPAGLQTVGSANNPGETAIAALNDYLNQRAGSGRGKVLQKKIFVVHRLDRNVSGLLVFAKTEAAKRALQENWGDVKKEYCGVVEGLPKPDRATLVDYLMENQAFLVHSGPKRAGAKKAITHYEVLERGKTTAMLKIKIETGRKHQIRVQLAGAGHPLVGDKTYGAQTNPKKQIVLHATRLAFKHPRTGESLTFNSPVPGFFKNLLA